MPGAVRCKPDSGGNRDDRPAPGDAFNPEWHEAIATESREGIEPGCVVSLMSRGYVADGKLIRAARVAVAAD